MINVLFLCIYRHIYYIVTYKRKNQLTILVKYCKILSIIKLANWWIVKGLKFVALGWSFDKILVKILFKFMNYLFKLETIINWRLIHQDGRYFNKYKKSDNVVCKYTRFVPIENELLKT